MTLVIEDRENGHVEKVDGAARIAVETKRLASLLERDCQSVREDLICGITLRTAGYQYSLEL